MTNEDLNSAIHKWLGKCWHEPTKWEPSGLPRQKCKYFECGFEPEIHKDINGFDQQQTLSEFNPDYCNDHDAVREFLKKADCEYYPVELIKSLYDAVDLDYFSEDDAPIGIVSVLFLTPRQLAEAGAKAVGIWRENKNDAN